MRWFSSDGQATNFIRPSGLGAFTPVEGDFHGSLIQNADGSYTLSFRDSSVHRFSSTGRLLSLVDPIGNQTSLAYDLNGRLISVTDPFGRVLTVTPDANGRVTAISDAFGNVANYTYGASSELMTVSYPDASGYHFSYTTANGNLVLASVTDALGNVLESHTYDAQGRALTSERSMSRKSNRGQACDFCDLWFRFRKRSSLAEVDQLVGCKDHYVTLESLTVKDR